MKKYKEMNGTEKIAYRNINGVFSWEVGGWFNCWQDGIEEEIPSLEEAKKLVYEESLEDAAGAGWFSCGRAPREMRFAGSEFIREVIDYLFEKDEDVAELKAQGIW